MPLKGSPDPLSGLALGLLSGFDVLNLSFRRLAGDIPRNELEILFRRVGRSVEGSCNVSALGSGSAGGGAGANSDTGNVGDAVEEILPVSGNAEAVLGTWKSPGSMALGSEWPSSTVVVVMRGDELVRYPA